MGRFKKLAVLWGVVGVAALACYPQGEDSNSVVAAFTADASTDAVADTGGEDASTDAVGDTSMDSCPPPFQPPSLPYRPCGPQPAIPR
jgi:hypothetical protein